MIYIAPLNSINFINAATFIKRIKHVANMTPQNLITTTVFISPLITTDVKMILDSLEKQLNANKSRPQTSAPSEQGMKIVLKYETLRCGTKSSSLSKQREQTRNTEAPQPQKHYTNTY